MRNKRAESYFWWLVDYVDVNVGDNPNKSYVLLMRTLHTKEFYWIIELDSNRASDGINLRYKFAEEHERPRKIEGLVDGPCTVLEAMVALASRCEHDIMANSGKDRTPKWFWDMIVNLGLDQYTDANFVLEDVEYIIDVWLDRQFKGNGEGSPFPLKLPKCDTRNIQMWYMLEQYYIEKYNW